MADLVDEHVPDDGAERFVVLRPVIEDRPTIEPDHVGHLHRCAFGAERQADALEQAEQIEFALGAHLIEHLVAREVVDLDDEVGAQIAKSLRQMAKHLAGKAFELGERGRLHPLPGERIGCRIGHKIVLAQIAPVRCRRRQAAAQLTGAVRCGSLQGGGRGRRSGKSYVGEVVDRDCRCRCGVARRRRGVRGGADPAAGPDRGSLYADARASAHRGQPAAAPPPPLRRLVCSATPAERHGALPGTTLLVGARMTPFPLMGKGWGWGSGGELTAGKVARNPAAFACRLATPTPSPPHKGAGNHFHSRTSTKCPAMAAADFLRGGRLPLCDLGLDSGEATLNFGG